MNRLKNVAPVVLALVLLACTGSALLAQEASGLPGSTMATQSLRPYWHVFIAYAIAITAVLAWVVSIGRRLRQVEKQLGE
jgi:CcmD family protein